MDEAFRLGVFYDEDNKTLIVGFPEDAIEEMQRPSCLADIPLRNILNFAKLKPSDVVNIAITSLDNFNEITQLVDSKEDLWSEFMEWRKAKQRNAEARNKIIRLNKDKE